MSTATKGMTASVLDLQLQLARRVVGQLEAIKTHCASCEHFELGACAKHGAVPLTFQKTEGECDDWRYDGIPF